MTTYTAWLTTDRSALSTDFCDVVILANDELGQSTGDPVWSGVTDVRYDATRADEALMAAAELLYDTEWYTAGPWSVVPTGYAVRVRRVTPRRGISQPGEN